ncbi:MAG: hypothetical protein NVV66_00100 [Cellulomonas sp.]|uniref:hypothetical protein n=1 Tax=Cellulomonas sp. TaxID=40001 RepID=UPI00258487A3|nr:hypothetical protein [Cellulomonas sp.]MCR6703155.1 hypothetical protein [Cellulomonas sp.]
MAYVGPLGIPLSRFLAWEPSDQDAALAWRAHESRRCPAGHHPDAGRVHHHINVCPACADRARIESTAEWKNAPHGAHISAVLGTSKDCARCAEDLEEHLERRRVAAEERRAQHEPRR